MLEKTVEYALDSVIVLCVGCIFALCFLALRENAIKLELERTEYIQAIR